MALSTAELNVTVGSKLLGTSLLPDGGLTDRMLKNVGGIEYVSDCRCWAAGFELGHSRSRGVRFNLTYTFLGLGDDLKKTGPTSFGTGNIGLLDSL